eukprot:CAMPEP_0203960794 /NCGR_PEP_ID=MMETSP0359-20131031/91389_1 /ASSEMBLY_ACC=CAM_ASM_000338 /TAXON_ID=268821 /ORGANISM="Scrippsiella Hangoei, Strain SHTV-5" /LENGTH=214 /DNA_ID=CAMNT_0050895287 /DNA_START=66 /DNA_END=710 /DNA_ORIENTATION=+
MARRTRSVAVSSALLLAGAWTLSSASSRAWVAPPKGAEFGQAVSTGSTVQPWQVAGSALMLAAVPEPAHAGGMFDFGLTLPFVAVTFLTMMAVLNALWYSPVTAEVDDRNKKLLKTLSEATDMLSKADEMQVVYTGQLREAREKASAAVKAYKEETGIAISTQIEAAATARETKAAEVKAKLQADMNIKKAAAEAEIEKRKVAFVKETLAAVSL